MPRNNYYQFALCAKDLSEAVEGLQAILVVTHTTNHPNGDKPSAATTTTQVGPTSALKEATRHPMWDQLLRMSFDSDEVFDDAMLEVQIFKGGNNNKIVIASASFQGKNLRRAHYKAVARYTTQSGDNAKICLHAEPEQMAALHLGLCGHDLPNTRHLSGLVMSICGQHNLTDPYCQIYSSVTGHKMAQTDVAYDDLNPTWNAVTLDLEDLCRNEWDRPVRILVMDHKRTNRIKYLGQIMISVNEMVKTGYGSVSEEPQLHRIVKGGTPARQGSLSVREVHFDPQTNVSPSVQEHCQIVLNTVDRICQKLQVKLDQAGRELEQAEAEFKQQQDIVHNLLGQATKAENQQKLAQRHHEEIKNNLAKLVAAAKASPVGGRVRLQLRAEHLPDLDFGIRNVSDPMYEIINQQRSVILRSNVIKDNLNPTWDVQTLSIAETGGLDRNVSIMVWDINKGDLNNRQLCGSIHATTIEKLVEVAKTKEGMSLGEKKGSLFVVQADVDDYVDNAAALQDYRKRQLIPAEHDCQKTTLALEAAKEKLAVEESKAAEVEKVFLQAKNNTEKAQKVLDDVQTGRS